jgi:hypothetical protein
VALLLLLLMLLVKTWAVAVAAKITSSTRLPAYLPANIINEFLFLPKRMTREDSGGRGVTQQFNPKQPDEQPLARSLSHSLDGSVGRSVGRSVHESIAR